MSYNFKTYNDLEIAQSLGETAYVLVEENGEVKRFSATSIVATTTSPKLDLYNIDNLSREDMITFAKEMKEFYYLNNSNKNGDLTTTVEKNVKYSLSYDDEDYTYDCDGCTEIIEPASWNLIANAFSLSITREEYNEILAAWEALCVNA